MTPKIAVLATIATGVVLANAAHAGQASAHKAHDAYLAAINANDADAVLAVVTDDIVLVAPNSDAMVGKKQVGPWVRGYFDSVETAWRKTSLEFVVSPDWAFERYAYTAIDTPRDGSRLTVDTGHGINIYRLDADGVWRLARDIWATNRSFAQAGYTAEAMSCQDTSDPC